jgi:hypothetical protein
MKILTKINKLIGKFDPLYDRGIDLIISHELAVLETLKDLINNIEDNSNVNIFVLEKLEELEKLYNDLKGDFV